MALFVSILFAALLCTVSGATQDYRDVSVFQSPLLGLFVATGVHVETTENNKGEGAVVDALRLIMWGSRMQYAHFDAAAWARNNNVTSVAGAAFDFYVSFAELIEYTETNNEPGYQIGEDLIQSQYYPGLELWSYSLTQTNETFSDGTTGIVYNVTFTTWDNVLSYWAAYSGHSSKIQGAQLDQNSLKLGFTINYFNNKGATVVPGTQIALVLVIAGSEAAGHSFNNPSGSSQPTFTLSSGAYSGFTEFETSANYIDVEGVESQGAVHLDWSDDYTETGAIAGYKAAAVILSYNATRPQHIYYDPKVGAQMPNSAFHATVGMTFVFIATLVALL